MEEIEVKILKVNRTLIEKTLILLGAKKVFDGEVETIFYDFREGTIIKQKNVLRLRKEQNKIELTYKKVHATQTAKTAEEYSVEISNLETMEKILENLGLSIIERTHKKRVSYTFDDARFDFDHYSGDLAYIPEFLEIEAKSTDAIFKYATLFNFKAEDCLPWSTADLIKHYSSKD
jgi:predicted adenylyl cyclase CyaB